MHRSVLLRGARQLLTLRGPAGPRRGSALRDLGIIENGAVLIYGGRIVEVGTSRRIENLASARQAQEIDASGCVVMPGFVDSHTHMVSGPSCLNEYEAGDLSKADTESSEMANKVLAGVKVVRTSSSRRLQMLAGRLIENLLRHGTTTVEIKSGYGLEKGAEVKILRVISQLHDRPMDVIPTFLGAHIIPPEFAGRPEDYIDWLNTDVLPLIRQRRLARFVDAVCHRDTFRFHQVKRHLEAARQLGFDIKIHADQFHHSGAVRVAVELGAVSADDLQHADKDDIAILAQSQTMATLLPGANFHLRSSHYAPARALIDQGAAVALASGFDPVTCPTGSMAAVISLACSQMHMAPAEAISAATINGAHALGYADRVGSLECGKQADLIVLDASDYREIPYYFGMNLVILTMKNGEIIYRRGDVQCADKS